MIFSLPPFFKRNCTRVIWNIALFTQSKDCIEVSYTCSVVSVEATQKQNDFKRFHIQFSDCVGFSLADCCPVVSLCVDSNDGINKSRRWTKNRSSDIIMKTWCALYLKVGRNGVFRLSHSKCKMPNRKYCSPTEPMSSHANTYRKFNRYSYKHTVRSFRQHIPSTKCMSKNRIEFPTVFSDSYRKSSSTLLRRRRKNIPKSGFSSIQLLFHHGISTIRHNFAIDRIVYAHIRGIFESRWLLQWVWH